MELKKINYFTEKEEAVINLLTELGFRKIVAKVLVYLIANTESTIKDIERGADLRQFEVSIATAYLTEKKWLTCHVAVRGSIRGRPVKVVRLVKPVLEIIASIEEEKKAEIRALLQKVSKLQHLVHECDTQPL
ncbi:MAG: ArsR family transcriptional regulator [Methanoregula sp.]|jgi:predicted transcriptional regulator|uniref:ArsR family transcriptional regulator n=1 Tax=Methanoregula sp. TaxID=2052170 RepID=UPI003D0C4AA5